MFTKSLLLQQQTKATFHFLSFPNLHCTVSKPEHWYAKEAEINTPEAPVNTCFISEVR